MGLSIDASEWHDADNDDHVAKDAKEIALLCVSHPATRKCVIDAQTRLTLAILYNFNYFSLVALTIGVGYRNLIPLRLLQNHLVR